MQGGTSGKDLRRHAPVRRAIQIAVAIFGILVNSQSANCELVPGAPLAAVRPEPGTVTQDQSPATPSSKVNSWEGLHIEILKGDRGVNIIKKKTAVTPVVEVKDRNNLPVAGVLVTFSSPSDGPSVTFLNGARSFSALTDANGQAVATDMRPLNSGDFQIQVSASHQGETATAVIAMTNVLTAADAANNGGNTGAASSGGGISHVTLGIIIGVAAAAGVGIAVGLAGHGGASSSSATSTTVSIGVGSGGTVGAPH